MSFEDTFRKLKDEYLELCNKRANKTITHKEYQRMVLLKKELQKINILIGRE